MINVFYGYGMIWSLILILYSLGWSDLCTKLDNQLLIFIIVSILISFFTGFFMRKKIQYVKIKDNPHKKVLLTQILVFLFLIDVVYDGNLPIVHVLNGKMYSNGAFTGIPKFHMLFTSLWLIYSFYLSYLYSCFKNKRILLENIIIVMLFILVMQRQNILICLLVFINMQILGFRNENKKISFKTAIIVITSLLLLLYGFGVFGNARYGSRWKWNDSSMISKVGKKNSKYPGVIPSEYFWSYTYMVTPLANLNYNVKHLKVEKNIGKFLNEFVPESFEKNIKTKNKEKILLPVSSLTASTSYVKSYKYFGIAGIYVMFIIYMLINAICILISYKKGDIVFIINTQCLLYFTLFSFFDNTIKYSVTSITMIIMLLFIIAIGIKQRRKIKFNNKYI